jgi:hypothetical protein
MNTSMAIYENFAQTKEIATALSNSDLVPAHFQKKPANVLLALEFAHRNDIAPFAAMQSMFVVSGKVGMSAAMAISLARKHNVWKGLRYDVSGSGETLAVKAIAKLHDDSEVSARVTMQQAHAAGWTRNAIYKSLPDLMLQYRAATFLIRTHFPEVLFGMQTMEELKDVDAAQGRGGFVDVTPSPTMLPPREESEDPRPRRQAAKPKDPTPAEAPANQTGYVVADRKERDYIKLLIDKFRTRTQDKEILGLMDMISTESTKSGTAQVLHQPLLDAVEGRGISALRGWVNNAVLIHAEGAVVDAEAVPF